jgi:hypothetical protein
MEVVLGFFSRKDGDLNDACPLWYGWSVEFQRLCWRTPLFASCLEIAGSYSVMVIHVFSDHLVSEEALRSSIVCFHHRTRLLWSMVKSVSENDMEAKFRGLAMVSLCDDEKLPLWFVTHSGGIGKLGTIAHEKFNVLPCRVKIYDLALIGCVWQWPCWRHCFVSMYFLQGENLWSMVGRQRRLYTVSFLEDSLLEKLYSRVVLMVFVLLLQVKLDTSWLGPSSERAALWLAPFELGSGWLIWPLSQKTGLGPSLVFARSNSVQLTSLTGDGEDGRGSQLPWSWASSKRPGRDARMRGSWIWSHHGWGGAAPMRIARRSYGGKKTWFPPWRPPRNDSFHREPPEGRANSMARSSRRLRISTHQCVP